MHQRLSPERADSRPGFSMAELLVVMVLIIAMLSYALPNLLNLSGQVEAGVNTLQVAVATARSISGGAEPFGSGFYSGGALLVCPNGDLRIVREQDPVNFMEDDGDPFDPRKSGYLDAPGHDYARLPDGVGVAGIIVGDSGPTLLTPPFSVRFDKDRRLVWRDVTDDDGLAFYNGNCDKSGAKETMSYARTRSTPWYSSGPTYNPDDWDPSANGYTAYNDATNNPGFHPTELKHKMPFDVYEGVVGIIVYSKRRLREAGVTLASESAAGAPLNAAARTWMESNGEAILINRYTGTVIKP